MNTSLNPVSQFRSVSFLAIIFSVRMLGLFIILPVLALYTLQLKDATANLIGIALGSYGLTQAILQMPLAILSDKFNRKIIIAIGLLMLILGSVIAALSHSIYGIIVGRALQGAGAIGSTVIALTADLTSMENRSKAMMVIGMSIGLSFAAAMVLGPLLNHWVGLSGIFWITALLGLLSLCLLAFLPHPSINFAATEKLPALAMLSHVFKSTELNILNIGIFILHAFLTANFIVIPLLIKQSHLAAHAWLAYLPSLFVAFTAVTPLIIFAEKRRKSQLFFMLAIAVLALTQPLLSVFHRSAAQIIINLCLFFTAFTFLESMLPSLVSKIAPAACKGTAMGVYSTSQFLGIFLGGTIGGWLINHYQMQGIFIFNSIICCVWLALTLFRKNRLALVTQSNV